MYTRNSRAAEMRDLAEGMTRLMATKINSLQLSPINKQAAKFTLQALRQKRCICCGGAAHETEMH